ncbi:hypothetical protein EJ02DRAFT_360094, partial [Clathrospora elynae]
FDTPKKARMKGAANFNDAMGIPYFYNNLFQYYGVSKQHSYEVLSQDNKLFDCCHHNNKVVPENRGAKPIHSSKDLHCVDRFLQDLG